LTRRGHSRSARGEAASGLPARVGSLDGAGTPGHHRYRLRQGDRTGEGPSAPRLTGRAGWIGHAGRPRLRSPSQPRPVGVAGDRRPHRAAARPLAADLHRPWERKTKLTLARVRRVSESPREDTSQARGPQPSDSDMSPPARRGSRNIGTKTGAKPVRPP
jgi:hypothetical protein